MEIIPYKPDNIDHYLNNIVMIPNQDNELNGFYKITQFTDHFFYVKKMKYETKLIRVKEDSNDPTKKTTLYEAIISNDFEDNQDNQDHICKKIKKTSVNQKYPIIICSVVQYEV